MLGKMPRKWLCLGLSFMVFMAHQLWRLFNMGNCCQTWEIAVKLASVLSRQKILVGNVCMGRAIASAISFQFKIKKCLSCVISICKDFLELICILLLHTSPFNYLAHTCNLIWSNVGILSGLLLLFDELPGIAFLV